MADVERRSLMAFLATSGLLVGGLVAPVHANHVREMSLEEKARYSDVVMIASVETTTKNCARKSSCATVRVLTQLKGTGSRGLIVLYDGEIAEDNPLCCKVGETYLFFLKSVGENFYRSVNGPYGVYVIHSATDPNLKQ